MTSAVQISSSADYTEVPHVVRSGAILGLVQSVLVFAFSIASRFLDGTPELVVRIGVAPRGYRYGIVDGDLVKLAVGTALVVDAIQGLLD